MHSVHRPGGMSVNSTTPSGFACHPSGGGEFWAGYSPPLEGCPKGGVVVRGSITVIFIMPIPGEGSGMADDDCSHHGCVKKNGGRFIEPAARGFS